jgi:hypothetical protein
MIRGQIAIQSNVVVKRTKPFAVFDSFSDMRLSRRPHLAGYSPLLVSSLALYNPIQFGVDSYTTIASAGKSRTISATYTSNHLLNPLASLLAGSKLDNAPFRDAFPLCPAFT